jgi:hypothetical protein
MTERRRTILSAGLVLIAALGCANPAPVPRSVPVAPAIPDDHHVYDHAERDRAELLAREVERLTADLVAAEQALVSAESGLRGESSRADAVSTLAGARIQIDRARDQAPWQSPSLDEAGEKLDEAQRQIDAENFGSAIFFAHRAERIAKRAREESEIAQHEEGFRRIAGDRVNLRDGPSTDHGVLAVLPRGSPVFPEREESEWLLIRTARGRVGWIHTSLVQ